MSYETPYQQFLDKNPYPRELKIYDNSKLINFSSNDYLGLAKHPLLISRSQEYTKLYGAGSASSRLVTGNLSIYEQLETQLAKVLGKPNALIMATGFQTNVTILEALLQTEVHGHEPLVFCDKLSHTSMLLGTRFISRIHRYQHNDLNHLKMLLEKYSKTDQAKFILAESIYSMEGDQADLSTLIKIAKENHAFLYIDDAHAVGVYGTDGWGRATKYADQIDIIMGTFSKALGSFGGYIACSDIIKKFLINKCKGLIYSTGLPPAVLGAVSAAIDIIPTLEPERQRLQKYSNQLRSFFQEQGLNFGNSNTHIIPWIVGDADKTLSISKQLEKQGILATTIRPPSVPIGKSRIRFCLSTAHSEADIDQLMTAIKNIRVEDIA